MKIKSIELLCNNFEGQINFFQNTMGFNLIIADDSFHFKAGFSQVTFKKSSNFKRYHFCFLIPCNQLEEAKLWCTTKGIELIRTNGVVIHKFEDWNAESIYFYDADGNILEFIVRHNLDNESKNQFDIGQIICFNEIGMPVLDIGKTQVYLTSKTNIKPWKGNSTRFGTQGDEFGLFLQVNPQLKQTWFPTNDQIEMATFRADIEIASLRFDMQYENGEVVVL